jgi:hypothetical protein
MLVCEKLWLVEVVDVWKDCSAVVGVGSRVTDKLRPMRRTVDEVEVLRDERKVGELNFV